MAKNLLWILLLFGFYDYVINDKTDMVTQIGIISILGVLAICESIEKGGENGQRSVSKDDRQSIG